MSALEKEIQEKIASLLGSQQLAVLSTQRDGQPYSSLMAFAFTPELGKHRCCHWQIDPKTSKHYSRIESFPSHR